MATFYWNPSKDEDIVTQWIDHLQNEAYVKDVNQLIEKNIQETNDSLKKGNAQQIQAINNVFGQLQDVNFHLKNIYSNITELKTEINNLASLIDWKMSQMIEEQRLTNQYLGQITQLLRIPDSQKQRVYYIENGIKYLKNAFLENDVNSLFYSDALENFKKAEEIESKDFITLNKIGQIYLYSKKYLDFNKAEKYFIESARESFAEYNAGGTTTSNNLNPSNLNYTDMEILKLIQSNNKVEAISLCSSYNGWGFEQSKSYVEELVDENEHNNLPINSFLILTFENFILAARCSYLQKNIAKAIEYISKAIKLIPKSLNAKFDKAKYLAANKQTNEAVNILKEIISRDRYFTIKIVNDGDLISKNEILNLLNDLKKSSDEVARKEFDKVNKLTIENTKANKLILEISKLLKDNNFLSNLKAIDMLFPKYEFSYIYYENKYGKLTKHQKNEILSFKELSEIEIKNYNEFLKIRNKMKKEIISNQVLSFAYYAGIIAFIYGIFRGCSLTFDGNSNTEINLSAFFIRIILFSIIGGLIGYMVALSKEPEIN